MDYEINKISVDMNGQPHGVLAINKPVGMTSHDVVDAVRRKYKTRKVGHAGALDPFASGVLIILVGRYTKLSNQMMESDKEYKCEILLGVETDTLDTEGDVLKSKDVSLEEVRNEIENGALKDLENGYMQQVPIFSSVKVDGEKLRVLARKTERHEIKGDNVTFFYKDGKEKIVEIPKKEVVFSSFEVGDMKNVGWQEVEKYFGRELDLKDDAHATQLATVELTVACSKGTYIRQLAKDIGDLLCIPAMLVRLERTRVGDVSIKQSSTLEDLN